MKKIITCSSYGGTGSSAISDLFKEFLNCDSYGSYEFRYIHDPDGISDLEANIVDNNNRLSTGYAIKRFKKVIDYQSGNFYRKRYSSVFGEKFKKKSYEYIEKIAPIKWEGIWLREEIDQNIIKKIIKAAINRSNKLVKKFLKKNWGGETNYFNFLTEMYYTNISREDFYKFTKEYTNDLFGKLGDNKNEYIMLDQLVPSSNINRYLNYFYDIKVIVVDRDPRDLFLLNKNIWKEGWIPLDVGTFTKWFRGIREHQKYEFEDREKILRIKFEDLIYDYEKTLEKILNFTGIKAENHTMKKKFFNPDISKGNTRLWNKYKNFEEEIKIIEKELSEYCYNIKRDNNE